MKSFRMLYAFMSLLILMARHAIRAASAAAEPASGKTYQIGTDITFARLNSRMQAANLSVSTWICWMRSQRSEFQI